MTSADSIFAGLVQRGLPEHVAAGIVWNLEDESGLNSGINEAAPTVPGSRGGYGLAQWTGPRRNALEAYAADRGADVSDPSMQLDFLVSELQGPEGRAYDRLMATSTPEDAAAAFATDFLRPAKQHLDRRVADYRGGNALADFPLYGEAPRPAPNALAAYTPAPQPSFGPAPQPGVLDIAGSYNRGKALYDQRYG